MQVPTKKPGTPEELAHHGVKGMKWGVRKEESGGGGSSKGAKVGSGLKTVGRKALSGAGAVAFELEKNSDWVSHDITSKATENLKQDLPGIKARHGDYGKLRNRAKQPFSKEAKNYRRDVKQSYLKHLEAAANEHKSPSGKREYTLSENGQPNTSSYFWRVSTRSVSHAADPADSVRVRPIFDEEGWIVDFEYLDEMSQSDLEHHGVKGMKWGVRRATAKNDQARSDFNSANPTRSARNRAIREARARQTFGKGAVSRTDQAVALRMTTGEKAVFGILAATGFATIPIGVGVGVRVAERRRLERLA